MNPTLTELLHQLRHAPVPVEVFGVLGSDPQAMLKRRYHELVLVAHPDQNPGRLHEASEAFKALQSCYRLAQHQLARGTYGRTPRITAATRAHSYVGYESLLQGDLCDLFPATTDGNGERVLLKVARSARNNDLLAAEAHTLRRIGRELADQPVHAHFPSLVEHFLLRDASGVERHTNVVRLEEGTASLADVIRAYPAGIELPDAAWMFNRVLAALGVAHNLGIVHGAVVPSNILIRPADHNGMLIDWCYSVASGEPLKAVSKPYMADYPPEVAAKSPATLATDLYMAARCMLRLLGSNGEIDQLPARVSKPIRALIRACLIPSPSRRTADAWQLLDDFHTILGDLYGPPVFRPFAMRNA